MDPQAVRTWLSTRVGYGSLSARRWFLGMEEACQDLGELEARLKGAAVEDLRAAHARLSPRYDDLFHTPVRLQRTWRGLVIAHLEAEGRGSSAADLKAFQSTELGSSGERGETLLAELMPLPAPNVNAWPYGQLGIPELRSRPLYLRNIGKARQTLLGDLVEQHAPDCIVAYGMMYWDRYAAIFERWTLDWRWLAIPNEPRWGKWTCIDISGSEVLAALVPHPTWCSATQAWRALGRFLRRVRRGGCAEAHAAAPEAPAESLRVSVDELLEMATSLGAGPVTKQSQWTKIEATGRTRRLYVENPTRNGLARRLHLSEFSIAHPAVQRVTGPGKVRGEVSLGDLGRDDAVEVFRSAVLGLMGSEADNP